MFDYFLILSLWIYKQSDYVEANIMKLNIKKNLLTWIDLIVFQRQLKLRNSKILF